MHVLKRVPLQIADKGARRLYKRRLDRFARQAEKARRIQHKLLSRIVRWGSESRFGRDHHLREIRTRDDFRHNIPIAKYDYYAPYIQRMARGDGGGLFPPGERLLLFTISSGTTGDPKLIPVNKAWRDGFLQSWQVWGTKMFFDHPSLRFPRILSLTGNGNLRRTSTNHICSEASAVSARYQDRLTRSLYAVPPAVFEIPDSGAKYYTVLRLALVEPIRVLMTATPATLVTFAHLADEYREWLIRDIADGTLNRAFDLPAGIRRRIESRIRVPRPRRAGELERVVERTGRLTPQDCWNLQLLCCWLGGTVGGAAQHLLGQYYGDVARRDIGLLSCEGRMTIPLDDGTPVGVLDIARQYYEFVPEDEIDSPQPTVLECHELEEGRNYFILLTMPNGLYRYNIYDVVRCAGYLGEAPLLEFLHKGDRCSDMEGEKVTEHQLVEAVRDVTGRLGLRVDGFTAVPVRPPDERPYYALMLEAQDIPGDGAARRFLHEVDGWLAERNIVYAARRSDRILGPPRLVRVPSGTWVEFARAETERRGVSGAQYKHPCLVLDESFLTRFPTAEPHA